MTFGLRTLRYPDLFPARIAGARCGSESFRVSLPGGPYLVSGLSQPQLEAMERRYSRWRAEPDAPHAVGLEVFSADESDFIPLGGPGSEYLLEMDPEPGVLKLASHHLMARVDILGSPSRGGVWTCETGGEGFIGAIENVLRPLVAQRVLASGGLLLHSSGVVIGNRCFVFVGQSGAGKSTIAGLALERGHQVLSDDLNHLAFEEGRWTACAMPFAGDHQGKGLETRVPVAGLFRLTKGPDNAIEPLSPAEGVSLLVSAAPFVNTDPYRADQLDRTIDTIVSTMPPRRLTFRKDASVWPIIEELCPPPATP